MARGFIYILTNPAMQGLIKIGLTEQNDVRERRNQLYRGSSGVPVPFEFYYAAEVPNVAKVEKALHEGFAEHRINPKREFFRMNPERVIAMLQMVDPKPLDLNRLESPATEEDKEEEKIVQNTKAASREMFRFSMVGIKAGDELAFTRDTDIKVTVVEANPEQAGFGNWVQYENKIWSLSRLATRLLGVSHGVNGALYWLYNGKLLTELRAEKERELLGDLGEE